MPQRAFLAPVVYFVPRKPAVARRLAWSLGGRQTGILMVPNKVSGMITIVIVASIVGAGLVTGLLFAFSNFVMRALADLPPEKGNVRDAANK